MDSVNRIIIKPRIEDEWRKEGRGVQRNCRGMGRFKELKLLFNTFTGEQGRGRFPLFYEGGRGASE